MKYVRIRNEVPLKKKIVIEIIFIILIAIITLSVVLKSIIPIINKICEDVAKVKATIVSNNVATEVMKQYTYDDFVKIYKDGQGNVTMLQSNIVTINAITSDVAVKIQNELIKNDESMGNIRLRKYYRN